MKASPKLKIIIVGCAAIVLLVTLKLVTFSPGVKVARTAGVAPLHNQDSDRYRGGNPTRIFKQFNPTNMEPDHPTNQTVTVTYDLRGPKEAELINKMNMTLLDLGIEKDERTVRQLVLARVKGDWSTTPPGPDWADNVMWQKHAAEMLKRKIGFMLATTNEAGAIVPADGLTIKRVLECEIAGTTVPPMEDFEVHE